MSLIRRGLVLVTENCGRRGSFEEAPVVSAWVEDTERCLQALQRNLYLTTLVLNLEEGQHEVDYHRMCSL